MKKRKLLSIALLLVGPLAASPAYAFGFSDMVDKVGGAADKADTANDAVNAPAKTAAVVGLKGTGQYSNATTIRSAGQTGKDTANTAGNLTNSGGSKPASVPASSTTPAVPSN